MAFVNNFLYIVDLEKLVIITSNLMFLFIFKDLFILERVCIHKLGEGQRDRERESRLPAQWGVWLGAHPMILRPWPKLKSRVRCLTGWATQWPLLVFSLEPSANRLCLYWDPSCHSHQCPLQGQIHSLNWPISALSIWVSHSLVFYFVLFRFFSFSLSQLFLMRNVQRYAKLRKWYS